MSKRAYSTNFLQQTKLYFGASCAPLLTLTLLLSFFANPLFAKHPSYPLSAQKYPYLASATFTYWSPYSQGMNLLTSRGNLSSQDGVYSLPTNPQPGFKAMIGTTSYCKLLDITLHYTWFSNPKTTKNVGIGHNSDYTSPFLPDDEYLSTLNSSYENNFQKLLLLFERNITKDDKLIVRFHGGGIATWDYQKIIFSAYSKADPDMLENGSFKQDWYGGGPYIGAKSSWTFVKDSALFAEGGAAILLASHQSSKYLQESDQFNEDDRPISNQKINAMHVEPMIDMNFGISKSFYIEGLITTFAISWEIQTYFHHNQFLGYYSPTGHFGNYSMQGLNINITLDF